ncbi:TonB-dependent siderophore receptor [Emcibacter sp.]|uniref:TonB-dependent siderophore receptor n=1 Tax=Emcibacter sp. TaxID=1979954 RepID=UPI003A943DAC
MKNSSFRAATGKAALLLSTSLLFTGTPSIAEESYTADNSDIEEITVEGYQSRLEGSTATKGNTPLIETPQSISIITSDLLELQGSESLNHALRYTSGITPESRGGVVSRYDMFTIRGFTTFRNYQDGLQLMYNGWYASPQIDTLTVERVEILKGPASVLYGNASPGGLINIISKTPKTEAAYEVGARVGTDSLIEGALDFTGALTNDESLSGRIIALGRKRDGQAITTKEERYVIAPSLTWKPGEDTTITLLGRWQNDPTSGAYGAAPALGSVFDNPLGNLEPDFYDGDEQFEEFDREQFFLGYLAEHNLNDSWTLRQNLRYGETDVSYKSVYSGGLAPDNRTLYRASIYSEETLDSFVVDTQVLGQFTAGAVEHNFITGLDYQNLDSTADVGYGSAPTLDIFNPDNNQGIGPVPQYYDLHITGDQIGIYMQDQIKIDRLVVLLSGRYDWFNQTNNAINFGQETKQDHDHFSGRAGILYHFDNGFAPYVSYSESFEPLSGQNFAGEPFKPTTGQQIEVGVKYQSPDDKIFAALSLFDLKKQNVSTSDPDHPGFSIQTGEVQSQGIEFEARTLFADSFEVNVNYTYLDNDYTKDNSDLVGNTPVQIADHTANVWLSYTLPEGSLEGLRLAGGVRYVGETFIDAANSDKVPSYTLVDASLQYDLGQSISSLDGILVTLSGTNIFDKRHVSGCYNAGWCWFGAERSIELGIKARW